MKKVVKKRTNKKNIISRNLKVIFIVVFVMYLGSSVILKNYNLSLNHELQTIQNENQKLKDTNQTLRIKMDELSSFERMSSIASKQGLENREGTIKNVR